MKYQLKIINWKYIQTKEESEVRRMREERQQKATLLAEFGNPAQKAHKILTQLYFRPESGRSLSAVASRKSACWARADFQKCFAVQPVADTLSDFAQLF